MVPFQDRYVVKSERTPRFSSVSTVRLYPHTSLFPRLAYYISHIFQASVHTSFEMSSLEAKLEQMKPYLGCLIILLNMSGMGIGIGKTVEGWHHVSAGIAACGVIMCVLVSPFLF